MRISVLIPTYKRVEKLGKCLNALSLQSRKPFEVIVIFRKEDQKTQDLLKLYHDKLPLKCFEIDLPGVIHAENLAIKNAKGELLSFIDDDGYAPVNWCERILDSFQADPSLIALGGPDNIIGDELYREDKHFFGYITWYGKLIGNHHHRGTGIHRVQVLKGVNMTIKKEVMPLLDTKLSSERFKGNGCHWELDVFLRITKNHPDGKILFDTSLEVQHESQHSQVIVKENHRNNARNLIYVYLKNLSFMRNLIHILYLIFIGHARIPGFLKMIQFFITSENQLLTKFIFAWQGVAQGFKLYLRRESK